MQLHQTAAEIFVPDGLPPEAALSRATHLGIGAHPDDLEFMAWHGIVRCLGDPENWFLGITVTEGRGCPRTPGYAGCSGDEMAAVRRSEQCQAATLGEYAAVACLGYGSGDLRPEARGPVVEDLVRLLRAARPQVVYTHNLCDMHSTHVGVALAALEALRILAPEERPEEVYGCEVWRSLDWMLEGDRVALDASGPEDRLRAIMGVFDSQISGGKRYDLAVEGRRRANATFREPRDLDRATHVEFAMDLAPLVRDPSLDPLAYALGFLDRLREDVRSRIADYSRRP